MHIASAEHPNSTLNFAMHRPYLDYKGTYFKQPLKLMSITYRFQIILMLLIPIVFLRHTNFLLML